MFRHTIHVGLHQCTVAASRFIFLLVLWKWSMLFIVSIKNFLFLSLASISYCSSSTLSILACSASNTVCIENKKNWVKRILTLSYLLLRVVLKLSPLISVNCFNWSWSSAYVRIISQLLLWVSFLSWKQHFGNGSEGVRFSSFLYVDHPSSIHLFLGHPQSWHY